MIGSVCDASHADEHYERTGYAVQKPRRSNDTLGNAWLCGPD